MATTLDRDLGEPEYAEGRLPSKAEAAASPDLLAVCIRTHYWEAHDAGRRAWKRQTEAAIRALMGRQHDVFLESVGQFVDVAKYMLSEEERWRQAPTFNWVRFAYELALSKLTENMPYIGAMPASADVADAALAEVWDKLWKFLWDDAELSELYDSAYGWGLISGRFVFKLLWDPGKGPLREWRADGELPLTDLDGNQYVRQLSDAPYILGASGEPELAVEVDPATGELVFGAPRTEHTGGMTAQLLNPFSVLVPNGPEPHHRKPWLAHRYYLTVDEVERYYGVKVEPSELLAEDDLVLQLAYASQYAEGDGFSLTGPAAGTMRDKVRCTALWVRGIPDSDDPEEKFGRLCIVTDEVTLYDEVNPYTVPGQQERPVLPFYLFDMPGFPFRQEGNDYFEPLVPINQAVNRMDGGMLTAAERAMHPARLVHTAAAIDEDIEWNTPGQTVEHSSPAGVKPVEYEDLPELPRNAAAMSEKLVGWLLMLGKVSSSDQGEAATADASGELQRQVRFDRDRPWGLPLRKHSYIWSRMAEDMKDMLSVCQDDDRLLAIVGDDLAVEFLDVRKELWRGRINVRPLPESQVLETKQDKQNRITAAVRDGLLDPMTAAKILDFPDMVRALRPGGRAYELVQREHVELRLGTYPPVLPEHDHAFHLALHQAEQQTLRYRNLPPALQLLFRAHVQAHQQMAAQQLVQQAADAGATADAMTTATTGAPSGSSSPAGRPGGPRPPSRGTLTKAS